MLAGAPRGSGISHWRQVVHCNVKRQPFGKGLCRGIVRQQHVERSLADPDPDAAFARRLGFRRPAGWDPVLRQGCMP